MGSDSNNPYLWHGQSTSGTSIIPINHLSTDGGQARVELGPSLSGSFSNSGAAHGVPSYLLESAHTLNNTIERFFFELHFIALETQYKAVFPHEHSTYYGIVPVNVNHIKSLQLV